MAHYLQSITPCLALGGELVYHRRPGEEGTVMSLAGKYTRESGARGQGSGPGARGPGLREERGDGPAFQAPLVVRPTLHPAVLQ